jgi:hypothetical protein
MSKHSTAEQKLHIRTRGAAAQKLHVRIMPTGSMAAPKGTQANNQYR